MARRLNTIIIVPHSKARFLKFSFSTRTLVVAVSAAVGALILSVIAIAYTGSAVNRRVEVQQLKSEHSPTVNNSSDILFRNFLTNSTFAFFSS